MMLEQRWSVRQHKSAEEKEKQMHINLTAAGCYWIITHQFRWDMVMMACWFFGSCLLLTWPWWSTNDTRLLLRDKVQFYRFSNHSSVFERASFNQNCSNSTIYVRFPFSSLVRANLAIHSTTQHRIKFTNYEESFPFVGRILACKKHQSRVFRLIVLLLLLLPGPYLDA